MPVYDRCCGGQKTTNKMLSRIAELDREISNLYTRIGKATKAAADRGAITIPQDIQRLVTEVATKEALVAELRSLI